MYTTSASLLVRLRHPHQQEAWSRFVRIYSPMLYTWARRLGLQHADVVDLVQDVFATLVQKLPEFHYDNHKKFRNWLWVVTRNKWREKYRRPAIPIDHAVEPEQIRTIPQESLEESEFRHHLLARLIPCWKDQFRPKTWNAFWACVAEGKSAPQAASELGLTVAAVYKAKVRVLARLHHELADLVRT